jgi:threonine dehydrogenase-like Zn-dependent dehydrogenase
MTGLYKERGLHKFDGFLTEYVVDQEKYMVRIPPEFVKLAVFAEPLSIVEKAIEQVRLIQSRLPWSCSHPEHSFQSVEWGGCKTALVVGAGPLGLLATALIRLARARTYNTDILPEETVKAQLVKSMGAHYIDAGTKTPQEIVEICQRHDGHLQVMLDASGAAETGLRLVPLMSRSSIVVATGIPRGGTKIELDAAELVRQVVRFNMVIVGSVNSNRRHFEMALRDIGEVDSRYDGMLAKMITHRFPLKDYEEAFAATDSGHIKTVIEVEQW